MGIYTKGMFTAAELEEIREKFYYVDKDCYGRKRLFFDNAGGSLRLKKAEMAFHTIDSMPDASEHSNSLARELADIEERGREDIRKVGREDIRKVIFNTKTGTIYPSYTASQIAMEVIRVILENAKGTNVVITILEHPSVFDAASFYSAKYGMELRVAGVNRETGGSLIWLMRIQRFYAAWRPPISPVIFMRQRRSVKEPVRSIRTFISMSTLFSMPLTALWILKNGERMQQASRRTSSLA